MTDTIEEIRARHEDTSGGWMHGYCDIQDGEQAHADRATLLRLLDAERARRVEWQPIETAPRDGTRVRILSADGAEEDNVYWSEERYCILGAPQGSRGPGWVSTEAGNLPIDPPTHWQPLPRPPATQHEDTP